MTLCKAPGSLIFYNSLFSATTVPEVPAAAGTTHWKGQLGGAGKQESGDSAFGEGGKENWVTLHS